MKEISILGVTGSIGDSSLQIIAENPNLFSLKIATANNNYQKLILIAKKFQPKYICIRNKKYFSEVKSALSDYKEIKIFAGECGLLEITAIESDIVISAIIGVAGLRPTLNAVKCNKILALANKESIVCAGDILINEAKQHNCKIIPIDSEHNAIFQLIENDNSDIASITLTASGGAFLHRKNLEQVTIEDALKHPNWKMGKKITIDSSTMVNKALEMIEACFLFNLKESQASVVIHPESIIHSFVSYIDGNVKALCGQHNMRLAIAHSLNYPNRLEQKNLMLDIQKLTNLSFLSPDINKFKVLDLVRDVLREGGIMPIIFNSSNEVAVSLFLAGKIKFTEIIFMIEDSLSKFSNQKIEDINHIFEIDNMVRRKLVV